MKLEEEYGNKKLNADVGNSCDFELIQILKILNSKNINCYELFTVH